MNFFQYEIPPTAGLPLHISDFFPKLNSFEEKLSQFIGVDAVQIECSATAALVITLSSLKKIMLQCVLKFVKRFRTCKRKSKKSTETPN